MSPDDESGRFTERVSSKNYVADVNFSMQYTRWLLTLLGIWPDVVTNSTRIERCVSRFLMPFPPTVITILVIPIISIPIFRNLNTTQFLLVLTPLAYRSASVIKNLILISCRDAIKFCIQHMETDWRQIESDKDRDIMMRNLRVGRSLTLICFLCQYSGTIFYNVLPFISSRKSHSGNESVKPVAVPGIDIYVDLRAGHNYEIVIFASCVSIFFVSAITVTICNLAAVLVCHACGQIQIVMSRLENLVDNEDGEDLDRVAVQKGIACIVKTHVRVLRFASKIDEVLRELCLIEVVIGTLMICLVEWLCITEGKNASLISYITLLVSYSFNMFIFCRIGELLKEQSQAVGEIAYLTDWYRLPGKTGLALVMLITTANNPCKLTAGQIVELSIMTFGNIMRTSLGYLNMLRTMTDD